MAYREVGTGDPIVFLHGNPTSSYLWRHVLDRVAPLGRCLAPDLVGMGDSDKLPDAGPGSYRFVEHRRHLDALLDELGVRDRVVLVGHDWGGVLAVDWARRHPEAVRGIAYLETLVAPVSWAGPNAPDNPMSTRWSFPARGVCRRPQAVSRPGPFGWPAASLDTACGRLPAAAIENDVGPGQQASGGASPVSGACWSWAWRRAVSAG